MHLRQWNVYAREFNERSRDWRQTAILTSANRSAIASYDDLLRWHTAVPRGNVIEHNRVSCLQAISDRYHNKRANDGLERVTGMFVDKWRVSIAEDCLESKSWDLRNIIYAYR